MGEKLYTIGQREGQKRFCEFSISIFGVLTELLYYIRIMGKTVSIYIDDEILKKVKEKNIPLSQVVREALHEWLVKEVKKEDYDFIEEMLSGRIGYKGKRAWRALQKESDRW